MVNGSKMRRKNLAIGLIVTLVLGNVLWAQSTESRSNINQKENLKRPNILFAFADDWGKYASVYAEIEGSGDLASLDGYLNFSYDGGSGNTTISVDVDGSSGTFESAQEIVLAGIDLTANGTLNDQQILDNLLNNGNLIVDQ